VTLNCATSEATIRYTTNGSEPGDTSAVYIGAIVVTTNTTIKAKAFKDGLTPSTIASATFTIGSAPGQMFYVPGGTFTMGRTTGSGDSNELPSHSVTLNSFFMGKYEVTQAEWIAIMGSNPASVYGVGENYPVYHIFWHATLKFCNLRSMAEGFTPVYSILGFTNPANWGNNIDAWDAVVCNWSADGYRLPTEAEWEYAAKGASNNPDFIFSGGDDINDVAWYAGNDVSGDYPSGTKPVGLKSPNRLGVYDMSGNVWEWCWDWYNGSYYSSSPSINPTGPVSRACRVGRGGCWTGDATNCRVVDRQYNFPDNSYYYNGFRLCRSIISS